MNHLYRSLWNDVTRTFVAVAEVASGRGKRSSGSRTAGTGEVAVEPARTLLRPMALEPRLMFDAAAVATAAESVHASVQAEADAGHAAALAEAARQLVQVAPPAVTSDRHEVAFIDTNVEGWQALRDGVAAGVEVVLLDGRQDGLAQMAQWASTHSGYDAIHVLSHGFEGGLFLGSSRVDTAALNASAAQLSAIGASLTAQGDILLYGCNVAKGAGQAFAERLAALTGADVAASSDATGAAGKGGDWVLEASVGSVEAASLSGLTGYDGLLVAGSAFVSGSTSDVTKELNFNIGLEKLSNGNTAVAYLSQVAGDVLSTDYANDPTAGNVLFDGVVKVLDGNNSVVRTINLRSDFSMAADHYVADAAVESLANGGFVVAWTDVDIAFTNQTVKYAIYDNAGSLQSSGALATAGRGPSIAAQANGDFAIAYQTNNVKQQVVVSVFDYGGSGFSFSPLTQTFVGDATASVAGADADTNRLYFTLTPPVLTALSDGSYVFTANTYDWVSSTYTPIGVFAFKLDATGAQANFASGKSWQRVDWDGSTSSPASVQSFSGGYAVVAQKVVSGVTTWQVTVYDNDGALRTATQQTAQVYNNGSFFAKTYYAVDVATMDMGTHDQLTYINDSKGLSATMYDNGTDLVLVFPEGGGGLKTATISKTTGQLVGSVTSTGITVPAGGMLFAPRFVADGGGVDLTYSVLYDKDGGDGATAGYLVGDIYQIGLDVVVPNSAPVATGLNGDSVAWAGVGNVVTLDAGGNATASDAESGALNSGSGDWGNGGGADGSLTVSRVGGAVSSDTFAFNTTGQSFTVTGTISGNLQVGGQTFATYTSSGGTLTVTFTSGSATATTALVQEVMHSITYRNDTPAGDAALRFSLSDGTVATTADVTVTSSKVYVTNTTDTATIDRTNGVSFSEAVAIANAQAGTDTVVLGSGLGTTVTLAGSLSVSDSVVLDANAASGFNLSGSVLTINSSKTLTLDNGSAQTATLTSQLAGAGTLVKSGAGTLVLANTGNNAGMSGGLTVSGGALSISNPLHLSSGTVTLDGGTLADTNTATHTVSNAVVVGSGGATFNKSGSTLTLTGTLDGAGSITKTGGAVTHTGTGTLTLNGAGLTNASGGTLTLGSSLVIGAGGATFAASSGDVVLKGTLSGTGGYSKSGSANLHVYGSSSLSGTQSINAGNLYVFSGGTLGTGQIVLGAGSTLLFSAVGTLAVTNDIVLAGNATIANSAAGNSTVTFSGNISETGGSRNLAITPSTGANTQLIFTGTNTYTGTTTLSGGVVVINGASNIGSGGVTFAGSNTTLQINGSNVTLSQNITLGGSNPKINVANAVTLSGTLSGSAALSKLGSGTLTLTGSNTNTNTVTVSAGTLVLSGGAAVADTTTVSVSSGATLTLNASETIGALSGAGSVALGANTLSFGGSISTTFSGSIAGTGALVKQGSGAQTLSGTNSYGGTTTITSGTLAVTGQSSLGAGAVTLSGGATFRVTGGGNRFADGSINSDNAYNIFNVLTTDIVIGSGGGTFDFTGGQVALLGTLTGAGALTISGSALNVWQASGYTGDITVLSGKWIEAYGTSTFGSGTIYLQNGSAYLTGSARTLSNNFVLTGNATIGSDDEHFLVESGAAYTLSGNISETGGAASLTLLNVAAGNAFVLAGTNSYTGGTTLTAASTLSIGAAANLAAGTLTMASGSNLRITGSGVVVGNAIALAADNSISVSDAATLSGVISGSAVNLTKSGSGTLTLTGSNTQTGTVTVSAGTLALGGGAAVVDSVAVTVNAGATLALNAGETVASLAGAGSVALGTSTLTLSGNASTTLSGNIGGSTGGLTKQGSGTLTLSGSNTYGGSTTLSAGTLALSGGAAVGDGSAVVMSAGTTLNLSASETVGSLSGTGTVALGSGTLTAGGDGSSTSFAGVIGGTGGLTKAGNGTLTLSGANSFTGSTTVSAGTLSLSNGAAIADTSAVTVASGATLRLHNSDETLASLAGAGTVTLNGGSLTLSGNASTTFSGVIQDGGLGGQNLVKLGSGTLTLSGANTYSGTTAVLDGTLSVAGDANLGSGSLTLNGGTLSVTGAGTIDNAIVIGVNDGTIDINHNLAITLSGALSGGGQLTVLGGLDGVLTLSNNGNAGGFSGGTRLVNSMLSVASDANLGAGTLTLDGGWLMLSAATVIDNALVLGSSNGTVMAQAGQSTLSGVISGSGGLHNMGSMTLRLSGVSTYTGYTWVEAGVLEVTGALNGTDTVFVGPGVLAGTGSIGTAGVSGRVVMMSNGALSPGLGAGGTGTLTLRNGLSFSSSAHVLIDAPAGSAGAYDKVVVQGAVDLFGGVLLLNFGGYAVTAGETFELISNDGSDAIPYVLFGLGEGATLSIGDRPFQVSYVGGDGNDVVFTALNAPPTVDNALVAQGATEDSAFSFTVPANTFADIDVGDTLTYTATLASGAALPAWLSFDAATRTFSGTPANGDVGAITLKVIATDGSNNTAFSNFTLAVANTNDAPASNGIAAQSAAEDAAFSFTVPANAFTDIDVSDTLTYTATLANGSVLPAWLNFNAATRTFSGTPANGDVGAISVRVTATDASNASASSDFTLTIANTNDAPTVVNALTAQAATEDAAFSFTVPVNTFADVDLGDTLSYTATLANGSALPAWLSFDAATSTFSGTPANGDVGAISVKVTATDGGNASASSDFTLTVANTNDAPTSIAIAAQAATEDSVFSFTVPANTFADVDVGDTLSYTATLANGSALPAWLSFNAATRTFSGTPANGDVGAIAVKVTATDASNASASSNFTLTVANTNDAPTSSAIAAQAATEDSAFVFTVPANTFADVDAGDTLTYTATLANGSALPAWLSFDAATRTFSGTPANGDVGAISVKVTATDASNASASSDFTLTIANTNDAPTVVNALTAQAATEDAAFSFTVPANTFADVDAGDTLTYTATLANGSALPAWLSFDAATRTFSGTPANGDVGAISVKVTATDGGNASASSDFALTVANTNDAPTVVNALTAQAATEDVVFSFTVPVNTFADVDVGDTLSYVATLANGSALPAWLIFNAATRTFSGTPANGDVGAISVKVTATDASKASASSNFTLTVANTNDAPTAGPIPFQSVAEDSAFVFTVPANTFSDVDVGDTLTYTATLANGAALPAWLSFDATTRTFSGTPANGDVGIISVTVTASDAGRASASSTFGLFVSSTNDVPTVAIPVAAQAATEDSAFSFTVPANTFSDVDVGDTLSYTALLADGLPLPAWLSFNTTTRTFSGTPANGDVGAITVKVTATDASYTSASSNFTLTVANTNDAPTAIAIAAQAATEDSAFSFTVPANTFSDVDVGDTLTYTATQANGSPLPAWLSFNTTTRTFTGTPANGDVGTISVKVTATDASNASVSSGFTLTVANTNDAPTVGSPITTPAATAKSPYSFTLPANSFVDADAGDTLGYRATLADGSALPGWLSFNAATRTFTGTPTNGDAGAITVRVTATDASNASVSASFTLTVEPVADLPLPETPPVPVPPIIPPVQAPIADVAATQLPVAVAFLSTGDTGVSLQSQLQGVSVAPTLLPPPPPPSPSFVSGPPLPAPAGDVAVAAPAAAERLGAPLSAVPDLGDFRVRSGQDVNVKLPDNFFT